MSEVCWHDGIRWDFEKNGDALSKRAAEQALFTFVTYNSFMCKDFNDEEKKKSIEFFQKCKKEFDALFAEKIKKMEGGVFDGIFEDGMR